jgi:hypothetical protein
MARPALGLILCTSLVLIAPGPTAAQAPTAPEKWELEVHGGGWFATNPQGGTVAFPQAGPPLPLATGGTGPRVSSWYFGDGAALLNANLSSAPFRSSLSPLDDVLRLPLAQARHHVDVGFRVSRRITPRVAADVTVDYSPGGARMTAATATAIGQTFQSFSWTMLETLNRATDGGTDFVNDMLIEFGGGGELLTTGALRVALATAGRTTFFVSGGAGVRSRRGILPHVAMVSNYQNLSGFPSGHYEINETDRLSMRAAGPTHVPVGVFGGGIDIQPGLELWRGVARNTSHWGIRVEARAHVGRSRIDTFVDARPSVTVSSEAADANTPTQRVIVIGTSPAMQFTTNARLTGFESSLTGPAVENFRVFNATGWPMRITVTTGLFVRF